jgi:WD40 repeat protein
MEQVTLNAPPGDGISSVAFSSGPDNLLLVSSWDSTTRLYDALQNFPKATYNFGGSCLTCCFDDRKDGAAGFCGGLDATVTALDLSRGTSSSKSTVGSHSGAVSCLQYCSSNNML